MKTVYIVLEGEDCEGAHIQAVFEKAEDAIQYIDAEYPRWRIVANNDRRNGCTSAFVEEWNVE